jgi:hypothetical protein
MNKKFISRIKKKFTTDNSIFIVSFPKCGRSWLSLLLSHSVLQQYPNEMYRDINQWKNIDFVGLNNNLESINHKLTNYKFTHDDVPQHKKPEELTKDKSRYDNNKVILLIRDPKDVMVSNFFQMTVRDNVEWAKDLVAPKQLVYSKRGGVDTFVTFYRYWLDYLVARNMNHLVISYEQLRFDPVTTVTQIFKFAGNDMHISQKSIIASVDINTFEKVKARELKGEIKSKAFAIREAKNENALKARKGIVGDYKNYLTQEDIDYINGKLKALSFTSFFRWR